MSNLISICFVLIYDNGVTVSIGTTIYLTRPDMELENGESFLLFSNPFDAKNYIRQNTLGDWAIEIAS